MRYVYSVVRFVPDPVRGEFINIGAIVGSDQSSEWSIRMIENPRRARALDPGRLLPGAWDFMDEVGKTIDRYEVAIETGAEVKTELTETWLGRIWEESQNVVQLSRPAPIVADHAEDALNIVFSEFIVEPEASTRTNEGKYTALGAVRRSYASHGLRKDEYLRERTLVESRHQHRERFDFTVANGRVLQLAHTWSFRLQDQASLSESIRAWAWTVHDIREGGATAQVGDDSRLVEVPRDVDVAVVYVPPSTPEQQKTHEEAEYAFKEIKVSALPFEQADQVGQRAFELLAGSDLMLNMKIIHSKKPPQLEG